MKKSAAEKAGSKAARVDKKPARNQSKSAPKAEEKGKLAKAGSPMTKSEKGMLGQLETTIRSGLASFVEVGRALSQIKADRLYREEDETFEDYCERRWDLSRQHGYRLIKAAECFDLLKSELPKGALLPRNESQLRPLEYLKPSLWAKAWKQALADSSGVKVTAGVVEKVVRKLGGKSSQAKPAARKKLRANVPTKTVANIVKVAEEVLERPKASVAELRKVLENIRDQLRRLSKGTAS